MNFAPVKVKSCVPKRRMLAPNQAKIEDDISDDEEFLEIDFD